jgi:predicted Zn-dependent peptidase
MANVAFDLMHKTPITEAEIDRWKTMIKLARADFLESSTARRDKLVGFYSLFEDMYDLAEFDAMRERITVADVMKHNAKRFKQPISIIAQGPKCDIDLRKVWVENFK